MAKGTDNQLDIGKALTESTAQDGAETDVALLKRLAGLEAKIEELKAENERIISESRASSGTRYNPKEKAFAGVEGYEFKVTPVPKTEGEFPHLKAAVIPAVDESEALRYYCMANETKPGTGQALDPLKLRLLVEPVGRVRADSIMRQKQIGALRKKVESGLGLSEQEAALLTTCEREIFQY